MVEQVIRPGVPTSGRVTPASFPFYTTGEDNLRIRSYNAAVGVRLKINGRLLDHNGVAKPQSWDHTPNTDRSERTSDITLSGTTLLNLTVFAAAGAPQMGQTFVIVQLIRGIGTGAIVLGTILQGYVTNTQALGWPGSPLQTTIDSGGYYRTITATVPAAGQEIDEFVPTGARWELLLVEAHLLTDGNPGNRGPALVFHPAGIHVSVSPSMAIIGPAAGGFIFWSAGAWLSTQIIPGLPLSGIPIGLVMLSGSSWGTQTQNLSATDQWASAIYHVREWLEP